MRRRAAISGVMLVVASSALNDVVVPPAASAQADQGATVHVALADGPWAGEHDAQLPEPCLADSHGPGSWSISGTSTPPLSRIVIEIPASDGTETPDHLVLTFEDPERGAYNTYGAVEVEFTVEDRGDSATLRGAGEVYEIVTEPPIQVEVTVECLAVEPAGRAPVAPPGEAEEPTPAALGSPPPGATTFHLEMGAGRYAGAYDVWTAEPACTRFDDGTWLVQYIGRIRGPALIAVMAANDEVDGTPIGSVTVGFPADAGLDVYIDPEPRIDIVDDGAFASLSVVSGAAAAQSWTGEVLETVELALTIGCASVES